MLQLANTNDQKATKCTVTEPTKHTKKCSLTQTDNTLPKTINQSIKVICNARNVVHKLESEARAVASGGVLMVIEKVGLEASFESV